MKRATFLLILILLFTSCTESYTMWQVIIGNYRYEQGRYLEATTSYFKALQLEYQQDIIYFNLGSLYHALGEADAAQEMWKNITPKSSLLLQSQSYYNRGVTYYQIGNYVQAIEFFKEALTLNSQDVNAKINLEIAQLALKRQEEQQNTPHTILPESSQRQLDYLKRRNTIFLGVETEDASWLNPDDI